MDLVYLDNAASTKVLPEVVNEMINSYNENYGNPSSTHRLGQKAKGTIERIRNMIANILEVKTQEIIFTSGGAEGNNLILKGVANAYRNKGKHIITSKIEHQTVLETCKKLEKEGYELTYIDVDKNGIIDIEQLKNSIREDTIIVSIMSINNETGVKQPIKEIGEILDKTDILFHTDAVQCIGKEILLPKKNRINAFTATAHKFYGPQGVGFVYLDKDFLIEKEIFGGTQERNRRSGTENISGIAGMGVAIKTVYDKICNKDNSLKENIDTKNKKIKENNEDIKRDNQKLQSYMEKRLKEEITDVKINGEKANRIDTITNITIKGCDVQTTLVALDMRGICISGGSACMSGAHKNSHVLEAMGLSNEDLNSSFRISTGIYTTKEEIDYFVDNLKEVVKIERGE